MVQVLGAVALVTSGCDATQQAGAPPGEATEVCAAAAATWKKCLDQDFPPALASACGAALDLHTANALATADCEAVSAVALTLPDAALDAKADQVAIGDFWGNVQQWNCTSISCGNNLYVPTTQTTPGGGTQFTDPGSGFGIYNPPGTGSVNVCITSTIRYCSAAPLPPATPGGPSYGGHVCPRADQVLRPSRWYPGQKVCLHPGRIGSTPANSDWCDSLPGERNQCAAGLTCINPRGAVDRGIPHGYCGVVNATPGGQLPYQAECRLSSGAALAGDNGVCQGSTATTAGTMVCRPTSARNVLSAATGQLGRYCLPAGSPGFWCDTNDDCQSGTRCIGGGSVNQPGTCQPDTAQPDLRCTAEWECARRNDALVTCRMAAYSAPGQPMVKTCQVRAPNGASCTEHSNCASNLCAQNRCQPFVIAGGTPAQSY
jgi:hypothetical protein